MNKRLRFIQMLFLVLFYILFFAAFAKAELAIAVLSGIGFSINLLIIAFHNRLFR